MDSENGIPFFTCERPAKHVRLSLKDHECENLWKNLTADRREQGAFESTAVPESQDCKEEN